MAFLSLHGYRRAWLAGDVLAGLTVWAVLVPEALAYASIAGVSPVVGLYAAPGALILYAALGSSRQLITGPMSATAALSAATVAALVPAAGGDRFVAMTATLAIATGLCALVAGLLRLGFLASFISEPVIKGFIIGLALTIIIGQVPKLLGVGKTDGDFFEKLVGVVRHLGDLDVLTTVVGILSLVVVLGLRRAAPPVPGSLVAVVLGVAAVDLLGLDHHGVEIVGHIARGLPSLGFPDVRFHDLGTLIPGALGVMLVGFAEGLGAAKTYAAREHQEIDAGRELLGLGGANLAAGLSSGMVVNGSLSKTAVNGSAGARSQLSGLVVAALTILTLLLLTGLFEHLPEATLAAVVIAAVVELVDVEALRRLYELGSPPDFLASVAALLGVLVFDTLPGLFIGIGVSLLLLLYRASRPHVARLGRLRGGAYVDLAREPEARAPAGVAVLRVEGPLFFANADAVRHELLAAGREAGVHAVVLDAETTPSIDATAAEMLRQVAGDLRRGGCRLLLARDVAGVRDLLTRAGDDDLTAIHRSVREAVAATSPLEGDVRPRDHAGASTHDVV
ncbi:MAG TPA: SulP family inorganic anion transporter [Baekduia sp.]|uniref:SulP family inorganic anion transporter n=1 Tax=Baekduia sp. TaxID=2600305 RepID=UPI002D78E3E0|nr:SulP family inorganic anion transporter [Baekduia sp.]HET6510269.1 SulP family inorganic anion transporter [Baekduia sp.]